MVARSGWPRSGRTCEERAGATGLEPATSGVTGRRSNQLNYAPRGSQSTSHPGRQASPCPARNPRTRVASRPYDQSRPDRARLRRLDGLHRLEEGAHLDRPLAGRDRPRRLARLAARSRAPSGRQELALHTARGSGGRGGRRDPARDARHAGGVGASLQSAEAEAHHLRRNRRSRARDGQRACDRLGARGGRAALARADGPSPRCAVLGASAAAESGGLADGCPRRACTDRSVPDHCRSGRARRPA